MKSIFLSIFLIASFIVQVQAQFDDYKYIVVPKRFDNFNKENQYRTSTLVKYLFAKRGFTVVYEDYMPTDLNSDRCLGLYANLIDTSSLFVTKVALILKDCSGKEVFITKQGKSKQKEYEAAYSELLRKAFNSFNGISHNYKPKMLSKEEAPITVSFKNDIKKLDEKPKLDKYQDPMVKQEATLENQSYKDITPIASDIKKLNEKPKFDKYQDSMVKQEATLENQSYKDITPIASDIKKAADTKKEMVAQEITESTRSPSSKRLLYAQETPNGYQLVDSTPKIQLKLYKSSVPNVYIAKGDRKDGVVYSKNEQWFFEYYENGELVTEGLKIKF